jgi:hypothetical protein
MKKKFFFLIIFLILAGVFLWEKKSMILQKKFLSSSVSENNVSLDQNFERQGESYPNLSTDFKLVGLTQKPSKSILIVKSLNNENISPAPARQITINELSIGLDALKLLQEKGWNGTDKPKDVLHFYDFDQLKLKEYLDDEKKKKALFLIPAEKEELFTSAQSSSEIQTLLLSARDEYIKYLAQQKVLDKYITELDKNVLPPDSSRIAYHPDNSLKSQPTSTQGFRSDSGQVDDHTKLEMNVYAIDVYNRYELIESSQILGTPPADPYRAAYDKDARDLAVRLLVYHEMTHGLQKAYENVHTPADKQQQKSAWLFSSKNTMYADTQYFWQWGPQDLYRQIDNRHLSQESQADGVSFEILSQVFDLSLVQRQALWDHLFGRFNTNKVILKQMQQTFEEKFPKYVPDNFGSDLGKVFLNPDFGSDELLAVTTVEKLDNLPAYVGYLNPLPPKDAPKFWQMMRED